MLKCVLLDANIIIEAYELGIWEKLIEKVEISVSSIVAHKEALFYTEKENGIPEPINLRRLIDEGSIKEIGATPAEMTAFYSKFDSVFVGSMHDGEAESLTLIMHGTIDDTLYCSGDARAIQALAMIGHSDAGVSFETLLKQTGLQKKLRKQFTERFFKENTASGSTNAITGIGLKKI